jgi:hypothetical protein
MNISTPLLDRLEASVHDLQTVTSIGKLRLNSPINFLRLYTFWIAKSHDHSLPIVGSKRQQLKRSVKNLLN